MPQENVLFVIVDDQRADTIGALGNDEIRTPALDRLCRERPSNHTPACRSVPLPEPRF